ncbi:hypothetical protein AB0B39_26580 [Micromonospora sp. NPDC049114]|uniref:hypothetical protein n=1 Tax=Micromonospora sp. NPDC049114 TaxID=3155498 RepID=UPI0033FC75D7
MTFTQGLRLLGFDADLVPAAAAVVHVPSRRKIFQTDLPGRVGWGEAGSGYAVVHTPTFNRAIDLSPCHNPALFGPTGKSTIGSMPVVLPLEARRSLADGDRLMTPREDYLLNWMLFPSYRPRLTKLLKGVEVEMQKDAEFLAFAAIDVMKTLVPVRNTKRMFDEYPQIRSRIAAGKDSSEVSRVHRKW